MLALAYRIESLVEDGEFPAYADAARAAGVSRARISHVLGLLGLAAPLQEAILTGKSAATERQLRAVRQLPAWADQLDAWEKLESTALAAQSQAQTGPAPRKSADDAVGE